MQTLLWKLSQDEECDSPPGPFKLYPTPLRNCKRCNITLQDLKNQWEKQKGICPYTGVNIILNSKFGKAP